MRSLSFVGRGAGVFTLAFLVALGCDGGGGDEDSGVPTGDSGQVMVPDLPASAAYREEGEAFEPVSLDWGCLDTGVEPTPGEPVDVTFNLIDFQDDFPVDDVEVWLFSDNEIANDCSGPMCQMFTTGTDGSAMVTLPANGWYAYRVLPKDGPTRQQSVFGVFQYNEPAPASAGPVEGNSVSGKTIDLIPALLGISREEGTATVSGRITDCGGGFVENAVIRLYDPDGNLVEQGDLGDEPSYHFFNGDASNNLPDQARETSHRDGLYVVVQVPVIDDRPYRVEAYANVDGETRLVGCESARIFRDAVTILNMTPLRTDAPASCPAP
ncbi:MAG: hypothetical protein SangKO_024300 [Sandaracinaceae bacterium]